MRTTGLLSLDVGDCGLDGVEGGIAVQALVAKAPRLRRLRIASNTRLGAAGLLSIVLTLAALPIRDLDLCDCGLEGAHGGATVARAVAALPSMVRLCLSQNEFRAEGIEALAAMTEHHALTHVELHSCGLEGEEGGLAAVALAASLPALEQLDLSGNSGLGEAGSMAVVTALSRTALRSLDLLSGCGLNGPAGCFILARLADKAPVLDHLDVGGVDADGAPFRANSMPQLLEYRSLSLSWCDLEGVPGGEAVGQMVCNASHLESLNLAGNLLGAAGLSALAAGVRENMGARARLITLSLFSCALESVAGGRALGEILACAPSLTSLDVSCNGLGNEGVSVFAAGAAQHGQCLKTLLLGSCGLAGASGGEAASELLAHFGSLQKLSLRMNGLCREGLLALTANLASCKIECLDVGSCMLEGAEAGAAVVSCARALPSLVDLQLGGNRHLCVEGVRMLNGSLKVRSLGLRDCGLQGVLGASVAAVALASLSP